MAVAYRSFYGVRELSTDAGQPTNALFGFIRALQQYEERFSPTHHAVVFDGGLPEERMTLLPEYKGQRSPMPDPLRQQLEPINEFLALSNYPVFRMDKQEADDVLATLAIQARDAGMDVLIATSDKDLFQLVDDHIKIVSPGKQGGMMAAETVKEKTGVTPEQIVAWLSLVGDSADNIPGVPGVGKKTAAKWLNEFGTLDAIWDNLEHLKPERLALALEAARDVVDRNVKLTSLYCDLDLSHNWDELKQNNPDLMALIAFTDRFELKSLNSHFRDQLQPDLFF